jgi:hypothetical protein
MQTFVPDLEGALAKDHADFTKTQIKHGRAFSV